MAIFVWLCLMCLGLAVAQTDVSQCPTNLQRGPALQALDNYCYEFVIHHHQDWNRANNDCHSKGGALLTIHSMKEQNFIMSQLGALNFNGNGVWLGLNDQAVEGTFVWDDGSPVDFAYWANGQPNGLGGIASAREDCTLLKYLDSGHWHDYPCSAVLFLPENYSWICKYNMVPTTTAAVDTVQPSVVQTLAASAPTA